MRPLAAAAALLLLCAPARTRAGDAAPAAPQPADAENPRNVRFAGPILETVRATPRVEVSATGDRSAWPPGTDVRFEAVTRVLPLAGSAPAGDAPAPDAPPRFTLDGRAREPLRSPTGPYVPWRADGARHELSVAWGADRADVETDALRVLLLVERRTYEAGERRFGSFVRRFRKSLDDLHALFAASVHPLAPVGILDRFRIDQVRVYDREEGKRPAAFDDHPDADVAIACDEGGPLAGFTLPEHSIGHNFVGPAEHRGIWSSWGEQALWHELMHFRGVQDFYLYGIEAGALPGRFTAPLPLPTRYARDLMASPYQTPWLSETTAVLANLRRGVARVGACEDTENVRFGHVWNFLPGRLALTVRGRDAAPAAGAVVRWWRALPAAREHGESVPGVAAGRAPDGEAVADAKGLVTIAGDYLGRTKPRAERSLWLLVEVERSGDRRFEVLYGLDLNLAYARGAKYVHGISWTFDDLIPVGASAVPAGR